MPVKGPIERPAALTGWRWETLCREDPGSAICFWLEEHEGLRPEVDGSNRGPWLRRFLRGGDGLPYCADIILSVGDGIGAPRPRPPRAGAHWYWHNRAVRSLEGSHKRGGTWIGPGVAPRRGWLCFWRNRNGSDAGPGGHVDVVRGYDPGERELWVIGANVGNAIKSRRFRLGHPGITGFAEIAKPVRG